MTVRDVLWMNAATGQPDYSAADLRLMNSALGPISSDDTRKLGAKSGVVPTPSDTGLKGTHNGATPGTLTVAIGQAWIDGTLTIGSYLVTVEVAEVFNVPAAGSVTRTDRVWVRARDSEVDGGVGSNRNGIVEYVAGDSGTGAAPAVPNHALLLCEVTVPTAGTPTATDKRAYSTRGDTVGQIVKDSTEQALIEPYPGMSIFRKDTTDVLVWTGTAWKNAFGPTWTTYTPTWTATSTNPTLGNGTLEGKFIQMSQLVFFRIKVTFGSTTTVGSGTYRWAIPVTAVDDRISTGGGMAFDTSASGLTACMSYVHTSETSQVRLRTTAGNSLVDNNSPYAWANGDEIHLHGWYEAA